MEAVNHYSETDLGNVSPNPRGEYDPKEAYEYLDLVSYQGGSYLCLTELGTTIIGTAPEPGHNTEFWQMLTLPGGLTSEYVAMHDNVVNKAAQVEISRAAVEQAQQEVEAAQADVQQLHEDTVQTAQEAENSRDSAAGYAQSAEASRKAAAESEQNINAQMTGLDQKVSESVTKATGDIATARQEEITADKLEEHTKLGNYYANNGGTKPYLEKKSNAYLDDFTKNAGSKNYTKFARDVNNWGQPGCQGQPWCAVYQFWKLVKIFGLARALQIMGGGFYNCRSVTRHAKQKGTWHSTPKKGALIIFRNGSHIGSVNSYDTTYVYTNEGNTSSAPGVVANGGACRNKKYKLTDSAIDGYVWIDYGTTEDLKSTETAVQLSKVPKWVGMVNTAELNVRSWPGKENPTIKKYPYLAQHNLIDVCDTIKAADGSTWYYVRIVNKYYGFVAARYITRV